MENNYNCMISIFQGKFLYANGDVFEGHYENHQKNGEGSFFKKSDGSKEVGIWMHEIKTGYFKIYYADGRICSDVYYKDGLPNMDKARCKIIAREN